MQSNPLLSLIAALGIWLVLLTAACHEPAAPIPTALPPEPAPMPTDLPLEPASMPTALPPEPVPVTQPANPTAAVTTATQPPEPPAPADATLTGSIIYRDDAALPAGATLTVDLRDISLADAPSVLIAQQVIPSPGPSPVSFRIDYRRAAIDPRRDYSLSARITNSDGRLLFTNDTVYPVLTYGYPNHADLALIAIP